jgi:hypothetical protein
LVKAEKMLTTEDDDTSIGPDWIEVRKTDCPSDANPSFGDDFFHELRSLLKNILKTEEASLRLLGHIREIEFSRSGKAPGNDAASPFCQGIDPDFGWD